MTRCKDRSCVFFQGWISQDSQTFRAMCLHWICPENGRMSWEGWSSGVGLFSSFRWRYRIRTDYGRRWNNEYCFVELVTEGCTSELQWSLLFQPSSSRIIIWLQDMQGPPIISEEARSKSEHILEKKWPYAWFSPSIMGQISGEGLMGCTNIMWTAQGCLMLVRTYGVVGTCHKFYMLSHTEGMWVRILVVDILF